MATTPPPASNRRVPWSELPARLRSEVERRLGSPVVAARTQPGGFPPGVAARLQLADGGRAFVKAVSPAGNPIAPSTHRREARIVAAIPRSAPVARLLFMLDDDPDGWVLLAFEDVDGQQPEVPWREEELDTVLKARAALAVDLTPSPLHSPLVADAAYFTAGSLQPPAPGLPTLGAFQPAQAEVVRAWLAERTGWP